MTKLPVYNLEFPDYVTSLNIDGYQFERVADYEQAFVNLQHVVQVIGGEFPRNLNTGTHQQTATVTIPDIEDSAILPWGKDTKVTKLNDVLLLLTLFVGRNVFVLNPGEEKYPLRPDPRGHFWGGQFRLSAIQDIKWRCKATGDLISDTEMKGRLVADYDHLDMGLEQTINQVLNTISSQSWINTYDIGYFIFLFRQAVKQSDVEPAFLLCWTIWEHLFALHNQQWLDKTSIEQTSGYKKISFILNKYLLISVDDKARREIQRIANARNRLVHYGALPTTVDINEMQMFIRLTDQIMAIILGLQPSNAFNSVEQLHNFLNYQSVSK